MTHQSPPSPALSSSREDHSSEQTHSDCIAAISGHGMPSRDMASYGDAAFFNGYGRYDLYPPLANDQPAASVDHQPGHESMFAPAPDQMNYHGTSSAAFTPEPTPLPDLLAAPSMVSASRGTTITRSRSTRETRTRKLSKRKHVTPSLTRPLSEVAKDFPDVPVHDVEAFAARSTASRQGVATKNGRVKRPLNAFMLYRKAYQGVALTQIKNETPDNQAVSRVCGYSWTDLETEEVRKRFRELASTETKKHKEAHPEYRYIPTKKVESGSDPTSHGDDSDGEYRGRGRGSRSRGRSVPFSDSRSSRATPRLASAHVPAGSVAPFGQGFGTPSPYWSPAAQQTGHPGYNQYQYGLEQQQQPQQQQQQQPGMLPPAQQLFASSLQPEESFQVQHSYPDQGNDVPFMQVDASGFVDPKLFLPHQSPVAVNDGSLYSTHLKPESDLDPQGFFWNQFGGNDLGHGCVLNFDGTDIHDSYLMAAMPEWNLDGLNLTGQNGPFLQSEGPFGLNIGRGGQFLQGEDFKGYQTGQGQFSQKEEGFKRHKG